MGLVHADDWRPKDVESLEPTAEVVVRSGTNTLVVAGPGAGKTELLAQRACYLLDTGRCPSPRRILAISFKRYAAKNLADRVQKRCGKRSQRFDSYTLDAFGKGLVDRFRLALPKEWRPTLGYEVDLKSLRRNAMLDWLESVGLPIGHEPINFRGLSDSTLRETFDRYTLGYAIPYDGNNVPLLARYFGLQWWREKLDRLAGQPSLSFPMLNRLAAYLLRTNPKVAIALRATYAFVFLDEFQDTTSAQYGLVNAGFLNAESVLTAVGDSKQRIMLWAGAMVDVFDVYKTEFTAIRHELIRNYRSAPELVHMQHAIANAIESGTPEAKAAKSDVAEGVCSMVEFSTPEQEAAYIADMIEEGITSNGLTPRDFCIIVRQRASAMVKPLQMVLRERNIRLRDESQLQDLLSEPVTQLLLAVLRLATRTRDSEAWEYLTSEVSALYGLDLTDDARRVEEESGRLLGYARQELNRMASSLETLVGNLAEQVGENALKSHYRQYARGSYLHEVVAKLAKSLAQADGSERTPREAIDDVIGVDVVPAMTIHKSKGLEFDTVVFLGLEDSQWWNFAKQPDEEKRGFFVAFSRAIQRVVFTFSDVRDGRWRRERQEKKQISDLYDILQRAGVQTSDLRTGK